MKEYQDFLNALAELRKLVDSYYVNNEFGEQTKLDEYDIEDLNRSYINVFRLGSVYLEAVKEENAEAEKADMEYTDRIQEQLQRDINAFQNLKPGMTLPSCFSYSNSLTVNVTGRTFKNVGTKSNTRQMMTITGPDGRPLKGFFTERNYVGYNPANKQYYIDKLTRQMPKFAEFFKCAVPAVFERNIDWESLNPRFGKIKGYDDAVQLIENLNMSLGKAIPFVRLNLNEENPVSPFDTRNVAVSNVAHLLGLDDKIAKSSILTVKNGNAEIKGSFMEFAKGEDPLYPKKDGGLLKSNKESFDYSPVLRTLSDIQVLDYICGNGDRHTMNMFYTCDENGKVQDVMGIDNDMSFGLMGSNMFTPHHSGLKGIFHMSRSMCEKVMQLDKYQLLHALDGLELADENKHTAVERLAALKEKISRNEVIVIEDEDYKSYRLTDFTDNGNTKTESFTYKGRTIKLDSNAKRSVYSEVSKLDRIVTSKKAEISSGESEIQTLPKDSEKQLSMVDEKNIKAEEIEFGTDLPAINSLSSRMSRAGWFISNSSPEFEKVKASLAKMKEATDLIGTNEKLLSFNTAKGFIQGYRSLLKDCEEYVSHKQKQGKLNAWSWTPAGRRISAVKAVAQFCRGRIQTLEPVIESSADKEYGEKADMREIKNDTQSVMNNTMTPIEIGGYIKTLLVTHNDNPKNLQMTVKLGRQMEMCINYIKEKGSDSADYNVTKEEMLQARELLKAGRIANAQLKAEQTKDIKDVSSKASIMTQQ